MILSIITRWDNQINESSNINDVINFEQINFLHFFIRNKKTLKRYVVDLVVEIDSNLEKKLKQKIVFRDLLSHDFWNNVNDEIEILNFISKQQKMFEFKKTHLKQVVSRWQIIKRYIWVLKNRFQFEFVNDLKTLFKSRINKYDKSIKSI